MMHGFGSKSSSIAPYTRKKERRNCVSCTFCGSGERRAEGKVRNKCGERKFYTTCAQRGGGAALTEGGNRGTGGGEK